MADRRDVMSPTRKLYRGNCPRAVSRDAKYSVIGNPPIVRLIYRTQKGEEALLVNRNHPRLIDLIKQIRGPRPQGVFYINEFGQVLVPLAEGYVCAGEYHEELEFEYEDGVLIRPTPPARLRAGDQWLGPHVGIPYVVSAGGDDIYYWDYWTSDAGIPHRRKVTLSSQPQVTSTSVSRLIRGLVDVKGMHGGRIYVNEARHLFAPVDEGAQIWTYRYLGDLRSSPWFSPTDCQA